MSTPISYTKTTLAGISGYDFSSITQAMINNYSLPLNQLNDSQKTLQTKKDAWRDINTRMSALENTLDKLRDSSLWNAAKATSSNTNAMTVSASLGAMKGTYNIKVTQTAFAQTVTSNAQNLPSADSNLGLGAGTISIKAGDTGVNVDIDIQADASLDDIAKAINEAKAGVDATVVKTGDTYRLVLISQNTGKENAAQFSDTTGNILQSIGVLDGNGEIPGGNIVQEARDAEISINGLEGITSSTNTFSDVIKGVTLNLANLSAGSTTTITVEADHSEAEKAVQAFVDQYNSLNSFLNEKSKYNPESKVKGDLFADPIVNTIRSQLRGMLSGDFGMDGGSTFSNLKQIGLSTSSENFGKEGKLEFNTAEFKEAISKDPEAVRNFLGGGSGTMETKGLANTYKDFVHDYVMSEGRLAKTIKGYDEQISDVKKRIEDFNRRIEDYTANVKLKFARLEALLSDLDGQRESMLQQLSQVTAT